MATLTAEARPGQDAFARYEAHHRAEAEALRSVLQSAQAGGDARSRERHEARGSSFPETGSSASSTPARPFSSLAPWPGTNFTKMRSPPEASLRALARCLGAFA